MSIHISVKSCPLTELFRRERRETNDSSSSLSAKAGDLLACAGLRRAVDDLEDEIMLQMCAIGELVYATHRGTPSDSDELQKILAYIDDLHDEIAGHEQQIKLLRGIRACPVCGEDTAQSDVYCQKCGQPLPVPEPYQS